MQPSDVYLCDDTHKVFFNNFGLDELKSGSLLECRNTLYMRAAHKQGCVDHLSARTSLAACAKNNNAEYLPQTLRQVLRQFAQHLVASDDHWSACVPVTLLHVPCLKCLDLPFWAQEASVNLRVL